MLRIRHYGLILAASGVWLGTAVAPATASWQLNGNPPCTVAGNQGGIAIVPSLDGSAIVVWADQRYRPE